MLLSMFLFGMLGGVVSVIYQKYLIDRTCHCIYCYRKIDGRRVFNTVIAWFISVPVGYTFVSIFNGYVFISFWLCSTLIMIIRNYTIKGSIMGGIFNGIFWYIILLAMRAN